MLRHKKPLLFIAPVVLALAAIGCGGDSKGGGLLVGTVPPASSGQAATQSNGNSGGTTGGATNNAQPTQAPANNNGGSSNSGGSSGGNVSNSELASLFSNFAKVKSFRMTGDIGGGQKVTVEIVQPDKAHYVIAGGSAGNIELISIGNDTYIKTGNTWIKQPGAGFGNAFNAKSIADEIQKASANSTGVTKGGTDTVNGKKCQIYTDTVDNEEICVADGLPLRVVSKNGSNGGTLIFSDYNANIDIKAPI